MCSKIGPCGRPAYCFPKQRRYFDELIHFINIPCVCASAPRNFGSYSESWRVLCVCVPTHRTQIYIKIMCVDQDLVCVKFFVYALGRRISFSAGASPNTTPVAYDARGKTTKYSTCSHPRMFARREKRASGVRILTSQVELHKCERARERCSAGSCSKPLRFQLHPFTRASKYMLDIHPLSA